jgi:2'-5' RNA ligase
MRLFTGIAIAPHVLDNLARALKELRPLAALNWSPLENLHITSKFIGAWPEERLKELENVLAQIVFPPFEIAISRFGYFPNPHHPHTLFAGVQGGPALASLASGIENSLVQLGVAREDRPYSPHLTLARVRRENIRELRQHIAKMTNFDFGKFEATDFHLFLSKTGPNGSVYTSLATYPLQATESSRVGSRQ